MRDHFFAPIAAARVFVFVRLLYLLLAVDAWMHFVGRAQRYGLGGFDVAHFGWLDAVQPTPSPLLYGTLMILVGFSCLMVALVGPNRILQGFVFVCFTYGWMMSQSDSYQHHYFLSLLLFLALFLPEVTNERASGRAGPDHSESAVTGRIVAWGLPLIAAQAAILYFWTVIAKLDPQWIAGDVIAELADADDPEASVAAPLLTGLLGSAAWPLLAVGTIAGELLIAGAYLLSPRRDRSRSRVLAALTWVAFITAVGLHGGIEVVGLRIGLFSYYMVALAAVFLLPGAAMRWVAGIYAAVGRRLAFIIAAPRTTSAGVRWAAAAIVLAICLPLLAAAFDLPDSALGVGFAAAVLLGLVFERVPGRGAIQPAYVLAGAVFALHMSGAVLLTNLRSAAYIRMARAAHLSGEYEAALTHYERAALYRRAEDDPPGSFAARLAVNRGDALESLNRIDEAVAEYRRAIELDPANFPARVNLAAIISAKGDSASAAAAELLVEAIGLEPENPDPRYNLAVIFQRAGQTQSAADQYRRVIEFDANHAQAHNNLAVILITGGRYADAVPHLRAVLRLDPDNASTLNNLAIILASGDDPAVHDPAGAIELAERAAALTGRSNPDILTTLARAHSAAGDDDKARAILDEVTALRQRLRTSP